MRVKQLLIPLLVIVIYLSSINVDAVNTVLDTTEMSINDKQTFNSNLSISLITDEPPKIGVRCFDVNSSGMLVVYQPSLSGKYISVLSNSGEFIYGYYISNCSQDIGLEWDTEQNDILNLYFVRSNILASVDSKGNVIDFCEVPLTIENNTKINNMLYSTSRTVGSMEYHTKNDMGLLNIFALSYSQIISVNDSGDESIIFDISSTALYNTVAILIIFILFVFVALTVIIKTVLLIKRKNLSKDKSA